MRRLCQQCIQFETTKHLVKFHEQFNTKAECSLYNKVFFFLKKNFIANKKIFLLYNLGIAGSARDQIKYEFTRNLQKFLTGWKKIKVEILPVGNKIQEVVKMSQET